MAKLVWDLSGGRIPDPAAYTFLLDQVPVAQIFLFHHCSKWESDAVWTVSPIDSLAADAAAQAERIARRIADSREFDPDL